MAEAEHPNASLEAAHGSPQAVSRGRAPDLLELSPEIVHLPDQGMGRLSKRPLGQFEQSRFRRSERLLPVLAREAAE